MRGARHLQASSRLLLLLLLGACADRARGGAALPLAEARLQALELTAAADGVVEPIRSVEVKSKSSGEIIAMHADSGDVVQEGQVLLQLLPRDAQNLYDQAAADLEAAQARLDNARVQHDRARRLSTEGLLAPADLEAAELAVTGARTEVVRAQKSLDNAAERLAETTVRSPITATVIAKSVEVGQVIASAVSQVSGGTLLFTLADLGQVQVRSLVDEVDIGRLRPGLAVEIRVEAYPERRFHGELLKIEPQAVLEQNVTMFPVLVRIANPGHVLKPGMNTEVEIHVGRAEDVLAVPYSALRTQRDAASAATVLGIDPAEMQEQLVAARQAAPAGQPAGQPAANQPEGGAPLTLANGQTVNLPPGVTETQVRAAMQKRRSGLELAPAERALLRQVFAESRGQRGGDRARGGGGAAQASPAGAADGDSYVVFVLRGGMPLPVEIRTGLTDLDYIEVLRGLTEQDTVLLLPSASLVQAQRDMRERVQRMTGGGLPGVQQQPAAPR